MERGVGRDGLVCAVLLWAAAARAHGPLHLVCARAERGGVKLDAEIGGWDARRFVAVGHERASFGTAESDEDVSFRFGVLWDARRLYVAVEVVDESVVGAPTLERLYEGDCVEIGLDGGNDGEGGYGADDYQFVVSPTGPGGRPRLMLYRNPFLKIRDGAFVRAAANVTTKGYVLEMAFAWAELGIPARRGTVVGFQIAVRDYDADGSKRGITWAPAADPMANPLRWGDLILAETATADVRPILDRLAEKNARWQRLLDGSARETDNTVAVDVAWATAGRLALGLGWNVQFRDGRFPRWDEAAWAAFLDLLLWTRPTWIRYGVNLGHWEPTNDDPDPSHVRWPGFAFRSDAMRHHYRVLDACQKHGIHVLWANWRIGDRASGVHWLAETTRDPALRDPDADPFTDAPYDPEELGESLAACLYHLRRVRGYTCVRQVSLWNEPDEGWSYRSPSATYPEAFWAYYPVLARHLRRLGIRKDVRILGPETSTSSYAALPTLARLLRSQSAEVDVLAHHDYLGYADYHRVDRSAPIGGGREAHRALVRRARRPVAVTEIGNMGNGAEEVTGDAAVWAGSLSLARLVLEGLNAGVAGFLRWEFKPYGVSWQNFGALTTLSPKHLFEPYRPVFFPHALLCRAAPRGATVLATRLEGGRDENAVPRVVATALYHRDAGLAVLLVNDGFKPKEVTVRLGPGVPASVPRRFAHLSYDASLPPTLQAGEPVAAEGEGRAFTLTLPPRSIHALATWKGFAQVPPLPPLPPRREPVYSTRTAGEVTRHTARMAFDVDYDWRVWQSTAGHTSVATAPEAGDEANRVCRIAYEFVGVRPEERPEHVVVHTDLLIEGLPLRVAFRLRGDGRRQLLRLLFLDARGEVFEYPHATRIRWEGWEQVDRALDLPLDEWNHWSGDGTLDLPLRGFGFSLTAPDTDFRGRGVLELDDLVITSESRAKTPEK